MISFIKHTLNSSFKRAIKHTALLASIVLFSGGLAAKHIPILNHNFDSDVIDPELRATTRISGWVDTGFGQLGVYAPTNNGIAQSYYNEVHNNGQVAYLTQGARVSQKLHIRLVNGERYTLTFDVGHRLDQYAPNFVARLKANGLVLAQLHSNSYQTVQGDWVTQTLEFTANEAMPLGERLAIEFHNLANDGGFQVNLDNITLTTAETGEELPVEGELALGLGLEKVTKSCAGTNIHCTLQCPAGKKIISGGCWGHNGTGNVWNSSLWGEANDQWLCRMSGTFQETRIVALCGNVDY